MTIRTRIIGAALAVVAIANIIYSVYFIDRERRAARLRLETSMEETNRLLGSVVAGPLYDGNLEQITSDLNSFFLNPDIVRISLRENRGDIAVMLERSSESALGNLIEVRVPVNRGIDELGEILVSYTTANIEQRLLQSRNELILLSVSSVLALAVVIFFAARGLTKPIDRLTVAARAMADGNLDQHIEPGGAQEIEVLGQSFVRMRQVIRKKMADLAENNRRLLAEISQRREAEQERDRLVSILEATTDIVGMVDPAGKLLYLNRAGRSLFGIEPGAALDRVIPSVHPQWANDMVLEEAIPCAVRDGVWSGETAILAPDGREIPVSQVVLSHTDAQGKVLYLSTIMRDITERKRTETALRVKDDAISASINAIAFADLSGRLSYVNRAFLLMWGYEREDEVVSRSATEFWVDPAEAADVFGVLTTQDDWSGELTARRRDGSPFVVLLSAVVIRDAAGQPVQLMGSFVDITERKEAEHNLRQLTAELEARVHERTAELETANRELEAFSYSVSHDLRAPLRAIDGFSQVLLEDYGANLDAEGLGYLERVRKAVQRMGHLIDDLLQLARVSRAEIHPAPVDLTRLAPEIIAELRETTPRREVAVSIAPGLSARGDPRLLQVVLANLIGNAWKYTGKTDYARIELGAARQDGETVYYVRDNGVGFDMQYAGKLFGAFQRMHNEHEFPGTGVGLATVARIIRRHGGRVWAESEPGKGATFFFTVGRSRGSRGDPPDTGVAATSRTN